MTPTEKLKRIIDELQMALDDACECENELKEGKDITQSDYSPKFHAEEAVRLIRELF